MSLHFINDFSNTICHILPSFALWIPFVNRLTFIRQSLIVSELMILPITTLKNNRNDSYIRT